MRSSLSWNTYSHIENALKDAEEALDQMYVDDVVRVVDPPAKVAIQGLITAVRTMLQAIGYYD